MARIKNNKIVNNRNSIIMKILVFLGVIVFCITIVYLMYHFFFRNSNIDVNYSTDKKTEYIELEGNEEVIATQKYISDLGYSMRYDVERFKVMKYKNQDFFRFIDNDRVFIVIEKKETPKTCTESLLNTEYNNCYLKISFDTEEYYISNKGKSYRITLKSPDDIEFEEGVKGRIRYMLNTFKITNKK